LGSLKATALEEEVTLNLATGVGAGLGVRGVHASERARKPGIAQLVNALILQVVY